MASISWALRGYVVEMRDEPSEIIMSRKMIRSLAEILEIEFRSSWIIVAHWVIAVPWLMSFYWFIFSRKASSSPDMKDHQKRRDECRVRFDSNPRIVTAVCSARERWWRPLFHRFVLFSTLGVKSSMYRVRSCGDGLVSQDDWPTEWFSSFACGYHRWRSNPSKWRDSLLLETNATHRRLLRKQPWLLCWRLARKWFVECKHNSPISVQRRLTDDWLLIALIKRIRQSKRLVSLVWSS